MEATGEKKKKKSSNNIWEMLIPNRPGKLSIHPLHHDSGIDLIFLLKINEFGSSIDTSKNVKHQ